MPNKLDQTGQAEGWFALMPNLVPGSPFDRMRDVADKAVDPVPNSSSQSDQRLASRAKGLREIIADRRSYQSKRQRGH